MQEYSALIIDDDVWMHRIISKMLPKFGFKKVRSAKNGFDGIAKAVEFSPDIIILDLIMPEISGQLTLRVLKSIKSTKDIPIIIISALTDIEDLGLSVKQGAEGFISKPFTKNTIYEKLLDYYGKKNLDLIAKGKVIEKIAAKNYEDQVLDVDEEPFKDDN